MLTYCWLQLMMRRLPWGVPKVVLGTAVPQVDGRGYLLQPSTLGLVSVQVPQYLHVLTALKFQRHAFQSGDVAHDPA
jgi:hypothetical protein